MSKELYVVYLNNTFGIYKIELVLFLYAILWRIIKPDEPIFDIFCLAFQHASFAELEKHYTGEN